MLKNKTTINHLETFSTLNMTYNVYNSTEKQTHLLKKKNLQ